MESKEVQVKSSDFITLEGLKELDRYKYTSGPYTWLDNKMNDFWLWGAYRLPIWMAPNLVTFIGFIFMVSHYVCFLFYDVTLRQNIPSWLFLKAGIEIFIYQTMDAMDGKQARRTGSSSPLGQLFDHGCDSFALTFILLGIGQAVKMDIEFQFILYLLSQTALFMANWIEYHTHILNTQFMNFGVTEMELLCSGIHIVTYFFGQDLWSQPNKDFLPNALLSFINTNMNFSWVNFILEQKMVTNIIIGVIIGQSMVIIFGFMTTITKLKTSIFKGLAQWIPVILSVLFELVFFKMQFYKEWAGIILITFGILVSLITCKLIICSLTHMNFQILHKEMIPIVLVTLIFYFYENKLGLIHKKLIFGTVAVINVILAIMFVSNVIEQITQHLGIYCFSLKRRDKTNVVIQEKKIAL